MQFPKVKIGNKETKFPLLLGGMAVRISRAPLVAAFANAGGAGVIGASGMCSSELAQEIEEAKSLTDGIVGVNIMVAVREFPELVVTSIKKKADFIAAGAGVSRDIFKWCKYKVPVFPIVSSARLALSLAKLGASGIIVESGEAGGHLGADPDVAIWAIIREVKALLKKEGFSHLPVIGGGGIRKGGQIWQLTNEYEAAGVQMATRFALSTESRESVSDVWLNTLLKAKEEDIVIIGGKDSQGKELPGSPVGYPGRVVKTPLVEELLSEGVFHMPGPRPRCKEACLVHCRYRDSHFEEDFCIFEALDRARNGDYENGLFFCGKYVTEIDSLISVHDIFEQLKKEYREASERSVA